MRLTALLPLAALAFCIPTARAAEGPLLVIPGKVIYESPLNSKPSAPWSTAKGKWEAVDGVLRGSELPEDKHPGVTRTTLDLPDAVAIEYHFRFLEGAKGTTLSVNSASGHVCRVLMAPNSFTVQKDDHDHEGPDKGVVFTRQAAELSPGAWHTVRMEISGDQMLGQCDGQYGFGSDPLIGTKKNNVGFTVSGQSVEFRNFKVLAATPNPKWDEVKTTLPAGKPLAAPAPKGKGKGAPKAGAKGKGKAKA
jgi:hypothetical protein